MKTILLLFTCITFISCGQNSKSPGSDVPAGAPQSWTGTWKREIHQHPGSLEITGFEDDSIRFTLSAASGGHSSEVEGKAAVAGNTATYYLVENDDTCSLSFEILGDTVVMVSQEQGNCFAAMGVVYTGSYYNATFKRKAKEAVIKPIKVPAEETLLSLGIFNNAVEDSLFRQLVGADYELFLSSTQLTSADEDLDHFGANVRSSSVRGLSTIMENIIMTDATKNIWAAVIHENQVLHYTNHPAYKKKLPRTIERWRSRFRDHPVIFK